MSKRMEETQKLFQEAVVTAVQAQISKYMEKETKIMKVKVI